MVQILKYGSWFVEFFEGQNDSHNDLYHSNEILFLFRPDSAEINSVLNTDKTVTSTLNFNIHSGLESSPIIQTNTITVTINRSSVKPILSITSKTNSVVEGQTATFIVTSNEDPMQPFYVSYIPTNSKVIF